MTKEPTAELMATTFTTYEAPTPWALARQRREQARETYWLATARSDGRTHVRPVLAVWVDDHLHFVSGSTTAKTELLAANPSVSIAVASGSLDLVVEGQAARVREPGPAAAGGRCLRRQVRVAGAGP